MAAQDLALVHYYAREGYPRHVQLTCNVQLRRRAGDPVLMFWRAYGLLAEGNTSEVPRLECCCTACNRAPPAHATCCAVSMRHIGLFWAINSSNAYDSFQLLQKCQHNLLLECLKRKRGGVQGFQGRCAESSSELTPLFLPNSPTRRFASSKICSMCPRSSWQFWLPCNWRTNLPSW